MTSESLKLAKRFLGQKVKVKIDRRLGEDHPRWPGHRYPCNYGFVPGTKAPDGQELDAYLLKVKKPVDSFEGVVVAIIHRLDNDDDKLIVVPEGEAISDSEIERMVEFQEKYFKHGIVR